MTSNVRKKPTGLRVPIFVKLVGATLLVLISGVGPIIYQNTTFFKETSEKRELEANLKSAEEKAAEIGNMMQSLIEKVNTIAMLSVRDADESSQKMVSLLIEQDHDLLAIDIYDGKLGEFTFKNSFFNAEKLSFLGITEKDIEFLRTNQKVNFKPIAEGQSEIQNLKTTSGVPLIGLAFPLARDEFGRTNVIGQAFMTVAKLQKIFGHQDKRQIFLLDRRGQLLAHPDESTLFRGADFTKHPLFRLALEKDSPRGQTKYIESKKVFHGAYAKTVLGPIVIAQIAEDDILEPARQVQRNATIIAGYVISGCILIVFLLSLNFVNPIEKLAGLIRLVSKGDFSISARKKIRSHDEVGDLAEAFDDMLQGLRERDKVKSLFSKFHGSSVTSDLLNKEVSVGGSRKNVTVFFSDIRGFTSFSESRSPEEVVEMLNEYFAIMVSVITQSGGIVDKFIGDAIMAVWGTPNESPDDTANAVKACLQMRKALAELNARRIERNEPPILIGMGLHTGHVISGTIGSEERMEYTVIGDTVNLSSRIESATKAFGTDLLISGAVAELIQEQFWIERAGEVKAKGKSEPIVLYKVMGEIIGGAKVPIQTPYSQYEEESSEKIEVG